MYDDFMGQQQVSSPDAEVLCYICRRAGHPGIGLRENADLLSYHGDRDKLNIISIADPGSSVANLLDDEANKDKLILG